jgi:3-deoxy-D-manno-octulosonic acid kinase
VKKSMTERIATADGAMLADPALADPANLGSEPLGDTLESLFDPEYWRARGELFDVTRGRGAAWFIGAAPRQWALRHYRRGGWVARVSVDRYVWAGEARVRAFAEWRLLATLTRLALPVPVPVAARYQRQGLLYRCDLITRRIPGALPLSERLAQLPVGEAIWREVGATVAQLHAAGADHADLNAHNILIDDAGAVSVIDFDRGRLRSPGAMAKAVPGSWAGRNVARLLHSLTRITADLPGGRFGAGEWQWFLDGYGRAPRLAPHL